MKKIFLFVTVLFALVFYGNAQNTFPATGAVGIGTTSPNAASLLEVKSTTKGVLIPRMTQAQRNLIGAPPVGLLIFQTDVNPTFYWYTGSGWKTVGGAARDLANLVSTKVNMSLLPATTATIDIGSSSKKWRNGYFSGSLSIGSLSATSSGTAVNGNSTGGAYGIYGTSTYTGVYGSGTSYGVIGSGAYGVYGSGSSYGLYGSGGSYGVFGGGTSSGVYGSSTNGYGVYAASTNSYGLYASNSSGSYGVVAYGGYAGSYGSGDTYGVYGSGTSYGVYGNTSSGTGVRGVSSSGYGVYGSSGYLGVWGNGDTYGVYGSSSYIGVYGTGTTYGVYGYSGSGNGGRFYSADGYGLWAETGRSDNNWAGVFQGNVYCYNAYQTSDKNLKKNIKEFEDAMSIINKLKPKNYEFKDDGKYTALHLPKGNHYGLLAQDLELVLPNLVNETVHDLSFANSKALQPSGDGKQAIGIRDVPSGAIQKSPAAAAAKAQTQAPDNVTLKAVNYTELIPIIIKGMQELYADKDKKINDLQLQIDELKTMIQTLKQGGNATTGLSSSPFLKQNFPNPFKNNTIISYYIPDNAGYAQIKITDIKGSVIKTFNAAKGEGQINIRNSELPAGTYNYTLYINNKTVDTRQMVLAK